MTIRTYRDAWGIPHLRADTLLELAFAQGRNAALDRASQIEVDRQRSQGTSAALLGCDAVSWDRFVRQARLVDTAQRCFRRLDAETRAFVTAYVEGVNAGLADGAEPWPPWMPLAIWLSTHILFAGFPTKLWREEVVQRLGIDAIELFATDAAGPAGSNGWLVPGSRTQSGSALLAGDPHRFIEDPGVYQQIHLSCPEFDVVGLAMPGVPGVAHFAHTGKVAWAITNAMADYQDLYFEQLRRRAGCVEALGPEGFRPASYHDEILQVSGGEPVVVPVIETERGPIVVGGLDQPLAISLRYVPRVQEDLGFSALLPLLRASTVADVDSALDLWVEPVNVVQIADTEGGLLQRVAGRVPRRSPDNMLRVVPAWENGRAWRGMHEALPRQRVEDVAVMANERGLSTELGVEFAPPHRARRIRELVARSGGWSAGDMAAIHTDTYLASALPVLDWIRRAEQLSAAALRLRERLLAWDMRMEAASTDAAVYAAVRAAIVRGLSAEPALAALGEILGEHHGYPELFEPWLALVPRVAFALEGLLARRELPGVRRGEVVRAALEEVAAAAEPDGPWSALHRLIPWAALPGSARVTWPGLSGDHDCILSTTSIPGITHSCARGPAARYVWDLAKREDSLWIVPLGASGVPADAHHHDQLPLWLRGELIPVITDFARLIEERHDA